MYMLISVHTLFQQGLRNLLEHCSCIEPHLFLPGAPPPSCTLMRSCSQKMSWRGRHPWRHISLPLVRRLCHGNFGLGKKLARDQNFWNIGPGEPFFLVEIVIFSENSVPACTRGSRAKMSLSNVLSSIHLVGSRPRLLHCRRLLLTAGSSECVGTCCKRSYRKKVMGYLWERKFCLFYALNVIRTICWPC